MRLKLKCAAFVWINNHSVYVYVTVFFRFESHFFRRKGVALTTELESEKKNIDDCEEMKQLQLRKQNYRHEKALAIPAKVNDSISNALQSKKYTSTEAFYLPEIEACISFTEIRIIFFALTFSEKYLNFEKTISEWYVYSLPTVPAYFSLI